MNVLSHSAAAFSVASSATIISSTESRLRSLLEYSALIESTEQPTAICAIDALPVRVCVAAFAAAIGGSKG